VRVIEPQRRPQVLRFWACCPAPAARFGPPNRRRHYVRWTWREERGLAPAATASD